MRPGQIYRHENFYRHSETSKLAPKYFVVLAVHPSGDLVARLLTSRAHARPEQPPCYHGNPYPGFYLGVIGLPLGAKSWVDLRGLEDFDIAIVHRRVEQQTVEFIADLPPATTAALLECAASADDTTKLQETSIRDCLASLR